MTNRKMKLKTYILFVIGCFFLQSCNIDRIEICDDYFMLNDAIFGENEDGIKDVMLIPDKVIEFNFDNSFLIACSKKTYRYYDPYFRV